MNSLLSYVTAKKQTRWKRLSGDSVLALGSILLLTEVISLLHLYQLIPDSLLLYLPLIWVLASLRGLYAALLASFLAFFLFDFLFVAPLYSIIITKFADVIALVVFLITAITTSQLASALRKRAYDASRRERESRVLYDVIYATNREEAIEQQLQIFANSVVEVFSLWGILDCIVIFPDGSGKLVSQMRMAQSASQEMLSAEEEAIATQVLEQGQIIDILNTLPLHRSNTSWNRTKSAIGNKKYHTRFVPLKAKQKVVGVLKLLIENDLQYHSAEYVVGMEQGSFTSQSVFFSTFLEQAVSIIERERLQRESIQNKVLQQTDVLRSALLSSVSHDLRTPLTTIKTAASSLLQREVQLDESVRNSFILAIERESDRLNRLVGNLLDMSRIEGGALHPKKVWYPLDEVIYTVLGNMHMQLQERVVRKHIPAYLPPVELDYVQIGQVVTNLLENAIRYTPMHLPLDISIRVQEQQVEVRVADQGPGIPLTERERIFDKFYRVYRAPYAVDHDKGSGLGLAVSKGIIEAHNGRIWVEDRKGGGAVFCFILPLRDIEGEQV